MNVIVIASLTGFLIIVVGVLIAILFTGAGNLVEKSQREIADEKKQFNKTLTYGFDIAVEAGIEAQLKQARIAAAKYAARMPRGANMRIGTLDKDNQPTTLDGIRHDPISAVKIAAFHGWEGLRTGASGGAAAPAEAPSAPAETIAPDKSPDDLVPGKDYPEIAITDDMSPAEVRKARIANAKARSAAVKALKESASAQPAAVEQGAVPVTAQSAKATQEKPAAAREPQPGVDYEMIEITDDMDPAAIRKARIANAKARSAAMKAFKEAGGEVETAVAGEVQTQTETVTVQDTSRTTSIPSDIAKPEYIEITDDMDPGDIRKARIANARARSTYHKALKEAGIDPQEIVE